MSKDNNAEGYQHQPNTGSIFTNEKARKETDPSFMGKANIDGALYRVVAWVNAFGEDKERISLKFETEEEFQAKKAERAAARGASAGAGGGTGRRVPARGSAKSAGRTGRTRSY